MAKTEVAGRQSMSLYAIEDTLLALLECDGMVPEEQQAEYEKAVAELRDHEKNKAEGVGQFLLQARANAEFVKAEAKRLTEKARVYENVADRLSEHVIGIIESLPRDAKGRPAKIEGHTLTLTTAANPASVAITDEAKVPMDYKSVSVTIPGKLFPLFSRVIEKAFPEDFIGLLGSLDWSTSKRQISDDLKRKCGICDGGGKVFTIEQMVGQYAGQIATTENTCPTCKGLGTKTVPGAELKVGSARLVIK